MSAGAFNVLHIPLREGRWASDDPAVQEAVINERLANDIWPNGDAVGHELTLSFDRKRYMVVGVAKNAHLVSLSEVGPMMHIAPVDNGGIPVILAETRLGLEERLGALVKGIDPTLRVELTALSASVRGTLDVALFGAAIAGSLGALALVLAIIGVFGVFSYLIEERRREIGIRLALGASRRQIRLALFSATKGAILGGITGGLMLSLIAGIALRAYLFGMSVADPMSYLAVAMMLIVSALVATAIPIRRAVRVDPAVTLRTD
jgi:hypothetical protein